MMLQVETAYAGKKPARQAMMIQSEITALSRFDREQ
jgi:hypothetical protein